nr:hypothetical protein [Tanacetum cinerariifolium]
MVGVVFGGGSGVDGGEGGGCWRWGGVVWFEDRLCVPSDQALREKVMTEA